MGAYSFKSLKSKQSKKSDINGIQQDEGNACYNCGNTINGQHAVQHENTNVNVWVTLVISVKAQQKLIIPTNQSIPRHEDFKSKLAGCTRFSKMDFKSTFWQIELEDSSRYVTVFHANGKLYRHKNLTMSIKTAQGELNVAHIQNPFNS